MARLLSALATLALVSMSLVSSSWALDVSFSKKLLLSKDTDFYGFDYKMLKKVSFENCQSACLKDNQCKAFTYNEKARFCFLKSDFAQATPFKGAISGRVMDVHASEPDLGKADKLDIDAYLYRTADALGKGLNKGTDPNASLGYEELKGRGLSALDFNDLNTSINFLRSALRIHPDDSEAWRSYSEASLKLAKTTEDSKTARGARLIAISAAINAHSTSRYRTERAAALSQLAQSLELSSRYREAIDSFKLALDLRENPADREDYRRLLESHGFRMVNHSIDADLQSPRICLQFSEKLKKGYGDFASFIRVDQAPPKALDISDQQICMEGLAHGQTYQIDVREGLPAENGEALLTNQQLELFIRDRAPGMRFTGNNYVLPANNRRGIPLVSVNADEAKLALYRVGDRSLANLIRSTDFLSQMESWQVEELVSDLGAPFWKGAMTIASEKNREVVTSIPIDEALPERKPGVYLLTASAKTIDLNDYPSLASQWFVISDIGLTTFSSTSAPPSRSDEADLGGLQVFARSLETALPLSGIKVELISRNNEILGTGISDETGMISFDAGLLRGKDGLAPSVLTASNGADDFVFLDLTRAGFDLSDRGVTGRASPEGIDLYAWTERGVYRPGEVVHLSALARDDGAKAVEDLPLTFIFERPDGVEVQRLVGSGKAMGGYAVDLPLLSSAQRGSWRANIFADTEKPALASLTFLVEDFIPDRTDMTLTPDSDIIALGDVASGKIEGRYLYGAPAAGLEISADVLVRETRSRKGYEGYLFGLDEVESNGVERVDVDALPPLDENGVGRFEFTLGELMASTRPKTADLIIRMQEGSGRAISRSVNYRIEPSDVMLGIKPLFDGTQVSENSNADFQLIAVNPDESRATESNVEWSLVKIDRHYQWYRDGNNWYFEAVDLESKVADGHVDLGKDDPAKLSLPVEWGRYRLALGETTSFEFRAGWVSAGGSVDTPDGLELALDKASYKVGDVAELKISPRFAGKLLLAIGTDRIHQTMEVDVPENGATLDIPVKEDWGAGAYLLANLYRPSDKGASRNPMRAIGVQWLGIEPEDRALTITMTKPATIRPHEQMVVPVKVEGVKPGEEAYVNVALVDEGILTLTHYKSPDPVGRYFGQRRLGVDIRDLYGRLIDGSSGAFGRLRTGGDGAGPQMDSSGEVPTQELVAFVSGIVKLNENGEAEVAFDIPQFNGTGRLMATAWTKKAVGGNDLEAIIRDPIVVHVGLPKVLAPGDASRALVELTNLEAPAGDYRIDILTNDAIELDLSQTPKVISLENDKMVTLSVPLHAKAKGVGDVTVKLLSASDNGVGVLYDAQVPVRSGMLPVTHVARIPLEPKGGKFVLDGSWFSGLQKSGATVSLSVGETGTFDVTSLLMQLDRYPYGCAEQVTSRALPLLYAGDLALHMPKELASLSGKEMTERIQKAIDTLLSYQSDLGGFSLWGGSSMDDPWLTAYATDFLTRAKEVGYKVPQNAMQQALSSVKNRLTYQSDLEKDSETVAYALYVLARNRMASAGDLRYYVETKLDAFRSPLSRAQLGAALALYGDRVRAERAFNSALGLAHDIANRNVMPEERTYSFSSIRRDVAGMLALAHEISPNLDSLSDIKDLARSLYDPERRLSTQEQAWMVLAARAQLANTQDLGIMLNGQASDGPVSTSVSGEGLDATPLTVINGGEKQLEATVTTLATPIEPLPAGGDGFTISRSYHRLDGSVVNMSEIKQNERFVVVVSASQLEDVPARLIISDLLPAGLEVENPHLISNSEMDSFSWLQKTNVTHVEFRSDRVLAAFDRQRGEQKDFTIAYTVRAVSPGTFTHPAAVIEDMYRPDKSARTASGWMTVSQ